MEKVGILVVSYGSRAAAMIDSFVRSEDYSEIVEFPSCPFDVVERNLAHD